MSSHHSFGLPDSWWQWIIPIALVLGAWTIKVLRDALMQKNAEMIVRQLTRPDNSGISVLQRLVRDEMIQHEIAMSGISKEEQRRRRELRERQAAGPELSDTHPDLPGNNEGR